MSLAKVGSWRRHVLKRTAFLDVFRIGIEAVLMLK
jgi:hypothetical protein